MTNKETTPPSRSTGSSDYYTTNTESASKLWSKSWFRSFKRGKWYSSTETCSPVEPILDMFHPYACHSCKRGPLNEDVALSQCNQCRVLKYCCRSHQKHDWPRHKKMCNALVKVKETEAEKSKTAARGLNLEQWRNQTSVTLSMFNKEYAGVPNSMDVQIVAMRPRCRLCFAAGDDKDVKLRSCPRCHGVGLCMTCIEAIGGEENLNFHGGTGGDKECAAHLLALTCTGLVVEQKGLLIMESNTDCPVYFYPKDWADYLEIKRSDFALPEALLQMAPVVALLSDGLSLPLTIHHALPLKWAMGSVKAASDCTRLVVHIVGASANEEIGVQKYIELIRLMPNLTYLRIILIGPDIRPVKDFPEDGQPLNYLQPSSTSKIRYKCDARVLRRTGHYHELESTLESPTIAIMPRSGAPNTEDQTKCWKATIQRFVDKDIPCVFTYYNRSEADKDVAIMKECAGNIMQPPTSNPFRGLRPYMDPMRSESSDFIFCNSIYVTMRGFRD